MALRHHAVLAAVSRCYPPPMDRFLRVTHPSATKAETFVRLACVKHAASVRSEPGSNSQVHHSQIQAPGFHPKIPDPTTTNENLTLKTRSSHSRNQTQPARPLNVKAYADTSMKRLPKIRQKPGPQFNPNPQPKLQIKTTSSHQQPKGATNISLPFQIQLSKINPNMPHLQGSPENSVAKGAEASSR